MVRVPTDEDLGSNPMAVRYAIGSLAEAQAYLHHDLLGARLPLCMQIVNRLPNRSAVEIFWRLDDLKFRSCMTLFGRIGSGERSFEETLVRYFGSQPDATTLDRLGH